MKTISLSSGSSGSSGSGRSTRSRLFFPHIAPLCIPLAAAACLQGDIGDPLAPEDVELVESDDGVGLETSFFYEDRLVRVSSTLQELPVTVFGDGVFLDDEGEPRLDESGVKVADPDGDGMDLARVVRFVSEDGETLAEWIQHERTQLTVGHYGEHFFGALGPVGDAPDVDWDEVISSDVGQMVSVVGRRAIQLASDGAFEERDEALWGLELAAVQLSDLTQGLEERYGEDTIDSTGSTVIVVGYPGRSTYEYFYGCNLRSNSPHISSQHWRKFRNLRVKAVSKHQCPSGTNYRLHRTQNKLQRVNSLGQWINAKETTKECYNCSSLRDNQTIKWCRRGTRFTWRLATAHWIKKHGQTKPRIVWTKAVRRFTCKPPS